MSVPVLDTVPVVAGQVWVSTRRRPPADQPDTRRRVRVVSVTPRPDPDPPLAWLESLDTGRHSYAVLQVAPDGSQRLRDYALESDPNQYAAVVLDRVNDQVRASVQPSSYALAVQAWRRLAAQFGGDPALTVRLELIPPAPPAPDTGDDAGTAGG